LAANRNAAPHVHHCKDDSGVLAFHCGKGEGGSRAALHFNNVLFLSRRKVSRRKVTHSSFLSTSILLKYLFFHGETALRRGDNLVVCNLHPHESYPYYRLGSANAGTYNLVLDTDAKEFGGWGRVDGRAYHLLTIVHFL
jgi:hypothetical protein